MLNFAKWWHSYKYSNLKQLKRFVQVIDYFIGFYTDSFFENEPTVLENTSTIEHNNFVWFGANKICYYNVVFHCNGLSLGSFDQII